MIAGKTWREVRMVGLAYLVILEMLLIPVILLWPEIYADLQRSTLFKSLDVDWIKRLGGAISDRDGDAAYDNFCAVMLFFRSANPKALAQWYQDAFGIDGPGELGLQAFNLAQVRSPLAVLLIFGGLLGTLQDDEPLVPLLRALGVSDDTPVAAMWRNGRALRIADGPDEVHKMVIARRELKRFRD